MAKSKFTLRMPSHDDYIIESYTYENAIDKAYDVLVLRLLPYGMLYLNDVKRGLLPVCRIENHERLC